jgi:hypothetical protein
MFGSVSRDKLEEALQQIGADSDVTLKFGEDCITLSSPNGSATISCYYHGWKDETLTKEYKVNLQALASVPRGNRWYQHGAVAFATSDACDAPPICAIVYEQWQLDIFDDKQEVL